MQDTHPVPEEQPALESHTAAEAPQTPEEPRSKVDTLPSLEELLREAELKAAEHYDAWLRAKAETENLRRRAQEDIAKAHKYAAEKFAVEMLPVKDSLEAALASDNGSLENLKNGVELTLKQLGTAFEKSGLVEISPAGEKFDPHRHQAITAVEAEGEPNRVLNVLQKGYALHERVIRPALVIVSKAKSA
ncbi:MAG: nucleotide exchange factor GrpE [Rhodocyclales bacterium]|nr:nucleotide exchange factor GrpE [Rhodocyclales bacterium]